MSLAVLPQDINKAALTIDLGRNILGDRINSLEIPEERTDIVRLSPMASHLYGALNHTQVLGAGALQNIALTAAQGSSRLTLTLESDARTRRLKWTDQLSSAAVGLVEERLGNPLDVISLIQVNDALYRKYRPQNDNEQMVCDYIFEAVAPKTNRDAGKLIILTMQFEEKKRGLLGRGESSLFANVWVKATGTCGGCESDEITFQMGKVQANKKLPDNVQVNSIEKHPQAGQLLIELN